MQAKIQAMQAAVDADRERELFQTSTSADRKGYGPLIAKAAILALAVLATVVLAMTGLYRVIRRQLRKRAANKDR